MNQELNIIGDIAGNFKTLKALLAKMPPSGVPLSVGDMCDRGPRSKEVLEFFKEKGVAILGNHEHMMLSEILGSGYYDHGVWFCNGGVETLLDFFPELATSKEFLSIVEESNYSFRDPYSFYDPDFNDQKEKRHQEQRKFLEQFYSRLDQSLIDWLKNLPLSYQSPGLFVSHGVKRPDYSLEKCLDLGNKEGYHTNETLIWNRGKPRRLKDCIQIFGHNSYKDPKLFKDKEGVFAIGIDTSRSDRLTGIHWPSLEIYEQTIID